MGQLRKIEQAIGQKIEEAELPADLLIEDVTKTIKQKTKKVKAAALEQAEEDAFLAAAFQEKKSSNAKTTNFGSGVKAKMTKKRNHS